MNGSINPLEEYNELAAIRGLLALGCKALLQGHPKVVDFSHEVYGTNEV